MRDRRLAILPLILILLLLLFFWQQRDTQAFGPAVALCPGPDLYGYVCDGLAYAYIDATNDTQLYADDGTISLSLPFAFTFYGTTYTEVTASTNGNLQFTTNNAQFSNQCLHPSPAAGMGDLIAPYWDDLDIRLAGFLETEVVGEAPNRIFVVEWDDVPPFGADLEDGVTFSVQLHETSNHIVFLYEDVSTLVDNNGRSATIGIQSAAQGIALQYSCNQPAVATATQVGISHPTNANGDVGLEVPAAVQATTSPVIQAKGDIVDFLTALNARGTAALTQWQQHWRTQSPARLSTWTQADIMGNGRNDLILLQQGPVGQPQPNQLFIFSPNSDGVYTLTGQLDLTDRSTSPSATTLVDAVDLTGDGAADLLLQDGRTHQLTALTHHNGTLLPMSLPGTCTGSLILRDINGDTLPDITQDGCPESTRITITWDGQAFTTITPEN